MQAIHHLDFSALIDSFISWVAAFIFGGLIGLERQYRQRTAGLRTNVLVAVGAAIFVDLANRLQGVYKLLRMLFLVLVFWGRG